MTRTPLHTPDADATTSTSTDTRPPQIFIFAPAVTCGCIADEKKQGTLGLLFLTHLNSADIVLGKFVSRALDLVQRN